MFLIAYVTKWNYFMVVLNDVECSSLMWQVEAKIYIWKATAF